MDLKRLVGSGDKIALFTLPFVVAGVILNVAYPSVFQIGVPQAGCGGSRSGCWCQVWRCGCGR